MSPSTVARGSATQEVSEHDADLAMTGMSTPCVKLCIIDASSGLCQGCGRRLDEIAAWSTLSETERRALIEVLPERLARSRAEGLAIEHDAFRLNRVFNLNA